MPACFLPNRGLVSVSGPESVTFLDNLLTISVSGLKTGDARYGGLLTPQGKIIVDGLVVATDDGFVIDCPRMLVADLVRRLGFYKLRAKVDVANRSDEWTVLASWADERDDETAIISYLDPRLSSLGRRMILAAGPTPSDLVSVADYDAHRIALGVPEGGRDFVYGDAFPHEADMDQLHGIDFSKGCYVGQEVVSRMQHRGTARSRCVPIRFMDGLGVPEGTEAVAGQKPCGRIGSSAPGGAAIALLRLDRVAEAVEAGAALSADGYVFQVEPRDWIKFDRADQR